MGSAPSLFPEGMAIQPNMVRALRAKRPRAETSEAATIRAAPALTLGLLWGQEVPRWI